MDLQQGFGFIFQAMVVTQMFNSISWEMTKVDRLLQQREHKGGSAVDHDVCVRKVEQLKRALPPPAKKALTCWEETPKVKKKPHHKLWCMHKRAHS